MTLEGQAESGLFSLKCSTSAVPVHKVSLHATDTGTFQVQLHREETMLSLLTINREMEVGTVSAVAYSEGRDPFPWNWSTYLI